MALRFASAKVAAPRGASTVARASTVGGKKTVSGKKAPAPAPVESDTREYVLNMAGVSAPFPDVFDPLGFSEKATIADVRRWRESELMHGRVAMLAALGFVIGEQLEDFPAFVNFDGAIQGPAIMHFQQVVEKRPLFWEALVLAIGLTESYRVGLGWATPKGNGFNNLKEDDEYAMGELGFDPLGLLPTEPEEIKALKTKELNNGRLAMIGIAGFVAQELVLQQEIFEHLFLRFEREVILELDDIEADLGLPLTPLPGNLKGI